MMVIAPTWKVGGPVMSRIRIDTDVFLQITAVVQPDRMWAS